MSLTPGLLQEQLSASDVKLRISSDGKVLRDPINPLKGVLHLGSGSHAGATLAWILAMPLHGSLAMSSYATCNQGSEFILQGHHDWPCMHPAP